MEEERNDEMTEKITPKQLKPCPHCKDGGHPEMLSFENVYGEVLFHVVCAESKGGCGATGGAGGSFSVALALWNMRAPLGYEQATWYGVPYDEACRALRKALIERDGTTCEMVPHPDYECLVCSNCGHEDDVNIIYDPAGGNCKVKYDGYFCTECGAPVKEGGAHELTRCQFCGSFRVANFCAVCGAPARERGAR